MLLVQNQRRPCRVAQSEQAVIRPRTREVLWLSICGAIAFALLWLAFTYGQDRQDARLVQAKPKPVPVRVDTVYVERYWGMTFNSTGPNGRLIVEFKRVPKETR